MHVEGRKLPYPKLDCHKRMPRPQKKPNFFDFCVDLALMFRHLLTHGGVAGFSERSLIFVLICRRAAKGQVFPNWRRHTWQRLSSHPMTPLSASRSRELLPVGILLRSACLVTPLPKPSAGRFRSSFRPTRGLRNEKFLSGLSAANT